jgi:hypothetical protein
VGGRFITCVETCPFDRRKGRKVGEGRGADEVEMCRIRFDTSATRLISTSSFNSSTRLDCQRCVLACFFPSLPSSSSRLFANSSFLSLFRFLSLTFSLSLLTPTSPPLIALTRPQIFRFETVDLYDAKNLPKVVYCIHALSYLMARQGLTGEMEDLVGRVEFTGSSSLTVFLSSLLRARRRRRGGGEGEGTDQALRNRR